MSIKINGKINGSSLFHSRFQPKDSFKNDKGIRCHNFFTALFVKLFGSGIDTITTTENKTIYLNKGSLDKWKIEAKKSINYRNNIKTTNTATFIDFILDALKNNKNGNSLSNKGFSESNKIQEKKEPIKIHQKKSNNTEENSWRSFTTEVEKYKQLKSEERQELKKWFQIKNDIENSTCIYHFKNVSQQIQNATNNDKKLQQRIKKFSPNLEKLTGDEKDKNNQKLINDHRNFFLKECEIFCPEKLKNIITNTDHIKNTTYNAPPLKKLRKPNKADIVIGSFNQNTSKLNNYGVSACSSISAQAAATFLYTKSFEEINEQTIDEIIQSGTKIHCIKSITAGEEINNFNIGVASTEGVKVLEEYRYGNKTISSDDMPKNLTDVIMKEFPDYGNPKFGMKTFPFAAIITRTPNTCCIIFKSDKEFWFFDSHGDLPFAPNDKTRAGVKKYTDIVL